MVDFSKKKNQFLNAIKIPTFTGSNIHQKTEYQKRSEANQAKNTQKKNAERFVILQQSLDALMTKMNALSKNPAIDENILSEQKGKLKISLSEIAIGYPNEQNTMADYSYCLSKNIDIASIHLLDPKEILLNRQAFNKVLKDERITINTAKTQGNLAVLSQKEKAANQAKIDTLPLQTTPPDPEKHYNTIGASLYKLFQDKSIV